MKFKLTLRSYVYLCFSIFVLALGLFRGEIFSSIAGIVLCFYFLYSFLSVIFTLCFWKHEKPVVAVQKNKFIILPGNTRNDSHNNLDESKKMFPLIFPGCYVHYVFRFNTDTNMNSVSTDCVVNLKRNSESEIFAPEKRGRYFCKDKFLRITDISHCYEFVLQQNTTDNLPAYFVFPTPVKKGASMQVPLLFAEDSNEKKNMQRNDELYDVRQYFPGDDTRKINWKVYAHLNDLTVRQGEFLPPPQKRFSVFVETPVIKKTELADSESEQYDAFINRVATFLLYMTRQGYSFNLAVLEDSKLVFEEILSEADDAEEKILKLLSVPQIIFTNAVESMHGVTARELTNSIAKDEGLMYFSYANSDNVKFIVNNFAMLRDRTFIYTGPDVAMPKEESLVNRFLFENKAMKFEKRILKKTHSNLNAKISVIQQERYYADKI